MTDFAPKAGDIITIDVEPHSGREFGGHDPESGNIRRNVIVLSNDVYNAKTGMIIGMVVAHSHFLNPTWYQPFADFDSGVSGNIVLWQIPNYDFEKRHGKIVGHVHTKLLVELQQSARNILS